MFENFDASYFAIAIASSIVIWQIYDYFNPKPPVPNA